MFLNLKIKQSSFRIPFLWSALLLFFFHLGEASTNGILNRGVAERSVVSKDSVSDSTTCDAGFSYEKLGVTASGEPHFGFTANSDLQGSYNWFVDGVLAQSGDNFFRHTFDSSSTSASVELWVGNGLDSCFTSQELLFSSEPSDSSFCEAGFSYTIDSLSFGYLLTFLADEEGLDGYLWTVEGEVFESSDSVFVYTVDSSVSGITVGLQVLSGIDSCFTSQELLFSSEPADSSFCDAGFSYTIDSLSFGYLLTFLADEEGLDGYLWTVEGEVFESSDSVFVYTVDSSVSGITVGLQVLSGIDSCFTSQELLFSSEPSDSSFCEAGFSYTIDSLSFGYLLTFLADEEGLDGYLWTVEGEVFESSDSVFVYTVDSSVSGITVGLQVLSGIDSCFTSQELLFSSEPSDSSFCEAGFSYTIDSLSFGYLLTFLADEEGLDGYLWTVEGEVFESSDSVFVYTVDSSVSGITVGLQVLSGIDSCFTSQELLFSSEPADSSFCDAGFSYTIDSLSFGYLLTFLADEEGLDGYLWTVEGEVLESSDSVFVYTVDSSVSGITVGLQVLSGIDSCFTSQELLFSSEPSDSSFCEAGFSYTIDSLSFGYLLTFLADEEGLDGYFWTVEGEVFESSDSAFVYTVDSSVSGITVGLQVLSGIDSCFTSQELLFSSEPSDSSFCDAGFSYTIDSLSFGYLLTFLADEEGLDGYLWTVEGEVFESSDSAFVYTVDNSVSGITVGLQVLSGIDSCFTSQELLFRSEPSDSSFCDAGFTSLSIGGGQYIFAPVRVSDSYYWYVDDVLKSTDSTFSHGFDSTTFSSRVKLMVTLDSSQCMTEQVVVIDPDTISAGDCSFTLQNTNEVYLFSSTFGQGNYVWTFGDSTRVSGGADVAHNYTSSGIYEVCMYRLDSVDTAVCSFCRTIVVELGEADSTLLSISGMLFADLDPIDDGVLKLYKKVNGSWSKVASTRSVLGAYAFNGLEEGKYLIHAKGSHSTAASYVPTYFVNGLFWRDAYIIDLNASVEAVDITLIRSKLLGRDGQGSLEGNVTVGEHESEEDYVVLLRSANSGKVVRWATTESASFSFDKLPFGSYQLTLEKPSHSVSRIVELNETQAELKGIEMNPAEALGTSDLVEMPLLVFPTQVNDKFFIQNQGFASERLQVRVLDMSGQLVYSKKVDVSTGTKEQVNLLNLVNGIYLVELSNQLGQRQVIKITK